MKHCDSSLCWASSWDCPVVTDSLALIEKLRDEQREAINLWELKALPPRSIVLTFCTEASRKIFEIARTGGLGRSVFCALHVFEASVDHAMYVLSKIASSDFDLALSRQAPLLELLNSGSSFKIVHREREVGELSLNEGATPFATLKEDLEPLFIKSVAEFFEIHYAHMRRDLPCEFSFTGVLEVSGILVAARRQGSDGHGRIRTALNEVVASVAKNGAVATVDSNQLVSFVVDGRDRSDLITRAAGIRGRCLTEFAVGVNSEISSLIDYSMSAQLNEGVAGLHVAVGDGSTGLHIDLLCPDHGLQHYVA